ncbi:CHAT domain-containing protein [Paenibacillus sp. GYB004]|uniref:CHAT domain-containing protein n=1 Tax=Paenibacillus sp. GYB004 TaxID=2994393 RepID=UPI002F969264
MALIDIYRSSIARNKSLLAKLQSDKAGETKKKPILMKKISSAQQSIARTKSVSTVQSKLKEIERAQNDMAAIDKKVADIERKAAKVSKHIADEERKLRREEEREQKKVKETLGRHEELQRAMQRAIVDLQNVPEKITVLFMASNPLDQGSLRLDEEAREIREMIRKSEHRDSVSFETRWAVRTNDVLQAINELNPAVIHFSGHGSEEDELVFQTPDGRTKLVSREAIVQVMMSAGDHIRLVYFNTCFSYGQAQAVVEHVDAAIGMNTSIGDDAARVFAAQFYSSISFGLSIQKAFHQAKAALMLEGIPEEDTPELYVRDGLDADEIIIVRPERFWDDPSVFVISEEYEV